MLLGLPRDSQTHWPKAQASLKSASIFSRGAETPCQSGDAPAEQGLLGAADINGWAMRVSWPPGYSGPQGTREEISSNNQKIFLASQRCRVTNDLGANDLQGSIQAGTKAAAETPPPEEPQPQRLQRAWLLSLAAIIILY